MRTLRTIIDGLIFAEGPRWHDGALHLCDMHGGRVLRVAEDGAATTLVQIEDATSGLGWLPDGRLVVVSMKDRKVLRQEVDGRMVEHADLNEIATFHCNDMVVGEDGTAYVGNFGFSLFPIGTPCAAAVARITADGDATVGAPDLLFPNGLAITADGRTLIVAESMGLCLTAYKIGPNGALSDRRLWASLGEGNAPDGICLDAEDAAWVAIPHQRKFVRIREGGEVVETIPVESYALACVLGGPERRTLYMAISQHIEPDDCLADPAAAILATDVEVSGAGRP